jgi:ubiquinone biosynthesis protein COQ4
METSTIEKTSSTDSFQQNLMEAILATFTATGELEQDVDFDAVNAVYANLTEYLVKSSVYANSVEDMKSDSDVAAIIQERYFQPLPELETLLKLPSDSLGYVYASQLKQANLKPLDLDPNLFSWQKVNSDVSYIEYRYQITHDIWHVVTGFDTSVLGELGLQAFYLAQFRLPSAIVALAGALIGSLLTSEDMLPKFLAVIERGWQMGKTAKPLIAVKWEEAWDKAVWQWQQELNIQSVD